MACSACQRSSRKKTPTSTQLRAKRIRGTCSKFSWNMSCCLTTGHRRTKLSEPAKSRLIAKIAWCIQRSQCSGFNGCHLEPSMHASRAQLMSTPQTRFSSRTSYSRGVRTFTLCGEENKLVLICKSAQERFVGVLTKGSVTCAPNLNTSVEITSQDQPPTELLGRNTLPTNS